MMTWLLSIGASVLRRIWRDYSPAALVQEGQLSLFFAAGQLDGAGGTAGGDARVGGGAGILGRRRGGGEIALQGELPGAGNPDALAARGAGGGAVLEPLLRAAAGRAGDEPAVGRRNEGDEALGTSVEAGAAARAALGIHGGQALRQADRAQGAGLGAGTEAEAGALAALLAAEEPGGGGAVLAAVDREKGLGRAAVSAAADNGDAAGFPVAAEGGAKGFLRGQSAGGAEGGIGSLEQPPRVAPAILGAAEAAVETGQEGYEAVERRVAMASPLPGGGQEKNPEGGEKNEAEGGQEPEPLHDPTLPDSR